MLVVVASRHDAAARAFCDRAAPGAAAVLSWRDLSTPGWSYSTDREDGDDEVVVGGARLAESAISAVITRCPSVPPHELSHIVPGDRVYVAAEMTATLLAWLSRLRCPVLNRPAAGSLNGPRWPAERWTALAAALGIPVLPLTRRALPGLVPCPTRPLAPSLPGPVAPPGFEHHCITVVGARPVEHEHTEAEDAVALAAAAGVALLRVHLATRATRRWFLGADLDIDLSAPAVADALLTHLGIGARSSQTLTETAP